MSSLGFKHTPTLPTVAPTTQPSAIIVVPVRNVVRRFSWAASRQLLLLCIAVGGLTSTQVCKGSADLTHGHPHDPSDYTRWATSLQLNLVTVVFSLDLAHVGLTTMRRVRWLVMLGTASGAFSTAAAGVPLALALPVGYALEGAHCGDDFSRFDMSSTVYSSFVALVVFASLRLSIAFLDAGYIMLWFRSRS